MTTARRAWVVGLLLSASAAAPLGGCRSAPAATNALPQPPEGEVWLTAQQIRDAKVRIEPVSQHDVGNEIVTSGRVSFDDLRVAHIYSPVTGRVKRILADPGERVKKGAALATIESPDVGNAFADLGKAQADLVAAEHDFRRQKELFEAHAGSQRDFESAEDNYGKAKAEMERAKAKARLFRHAAGDAVSQEFTLRAPIEGEVIARSVNPGAEVQGQYSGGTAVELFTVGELDSVWVFADVFEMDLARVQKGAPVSIKVVAYPDRAFAGKVDWIADALDPTSRTARVRCSLPNTARELKPEMYATVAISVAAPSVPALPRAALLRIGDQTVVFVQTGNTSDGRVKFSRRIVAVNEDEGADYLPIVRGVGAGDQVVTTGAILLSGML
ncbi:MAG TPA: efflux RND transporter periplasmic adaptor subunit [Polyangia bacterium]|jgi:cobalt-zinc-cadmium efflux system membrane fusion protein|nr:efflux RND transporter periplasmic adaptor subunit [Polyangia bacterium]